MAKNSISVAEAVSKMQGSNGKFMTVTFTKRGNNAIRTMNCRTGVSKGVKGTRRARKNAGLMTVYDMTKREFRNINVSGLRSLRLNGLEYQVV